MKEIQKKGKQRVKGTVLFTVVAVMMVMVVFLMSTLILTSSAQRRSYYTYFETQAQYAAQAALDAITNSAYTDQDFYNWVISINEGDPAQTIDVRLDGTGIQLADPDLGANSEDTVRCQIVRDTSTYKWDEVNRRIYEQQSWKITAKAVVGTGRNSSEYSVSNYIYTNVLNATPGAAPSDSLTGNSYDRFLTETPGAGSGSSSSKVPGGYAIGGSGSGGGNYVTLGPQAANLSTIPAGRTRYGTVTDYSDSKSNDSHAVGNITIYRNQNISAQFYAIFQNPGERAIYMGDVNVSGGNGVFWKSTLKTSDLSSLTYQTQNYVYIDGTLTSTNKSAVGSEIEGTEANGKTGNAQVNLFAGAVQISGNDFRVYGDTYLYDPALDSKISKSTSSRISTFVSNNITKSNNLLVGKTNGGNLISNNKTLTLGENVTIDGDLIFTNPLGELVISSNITVKGDVICAGTLEVQQYCNINATGTIMARRAEQINRNVEVISWWPYEEKVTVEIIDGYDKKAQYETAYANNIASKKATGYYKAGFTLPTGSVTIGDTTETLNVDYSLFPFEYRLDEMFEQYYRWDLTVVDKSAFEVDATTGEILHVKVNANGVPDANGTYDSLIEESRAAGHKWYFETFDKANGYGPNATTATYGVYYVPFTRPTVAANQFMSVPKPVDEQNPTGVLNGGATVISTRKGFDSAYDEVSQSYSFPKVDCTVTQNVRMYSHDSNGNLKLFTASEAANAASSGQANATQAIVIEDSCVLDVQDLYNSNNSLIFVEPSKHSDGNPIKIVIKGGYMSDKKIAIVVNNTARYYGDDVADPKLENPIAYADDVDETGTPKGYAGRAQVEFFFEDGVGFAGTTSIVTTGMLGQAAEKKLNVVSNPIYPGSAGWSTLDAKDKYLYELVPNIVIYGEEGGKISMANGAFITAELLMPYTTFEIATQILKTSPTVYREYMDSKEYSVAGSYGINVIGSVFVKEFGSNNMPVIVYMGDDQRDPPDDPVYTPDSSSNNQGAQSGGASRNNDYFSNNYQGAN